jgi:hypothetical protein
MSVIEETSAIKDAQQAVDIAKTHLLAIYKGEELFNLGLEEVEHLGQGDWLVTLGFSRAWDKGNNVLTALYNPRRSYKSVSVKSDGSIGAIKSKSID